MNRPDWEQVTGWCACGGSFSARSSPAGWAANVSSTFRELHDGPECHPVDQAEHRRITARLRRQEARQRRAGS